MAEELPGSVAGELMLAEALRLVPGYGDGGPSVRVHLLPGGSVNRTYSVSTAEGCFVVRISPGPDAWLASDRSVERGIHRIAAAAGIAPSVVASGEGWLITEYVRGPLWSEADFCEPRRLAQLARTLRRLHELPPPDFGRFDLLEAPGRYAGRAGAPEGYLAHASRAWAVSGGSSRPVAILHHDLHGSNLIDGPGGLVLIDWECAAVGDPLLDLACLLSYHEAARPYAALLLQEAGLRDVTAPQLAASVWLFDLHTYLWYRERRTRIGATEAELRAEALLAARLPRTLGDWD